MEVQVAVAVDRVPNCDEFWYYEDVTVMRSAV